jgi:hypothetical protein
MAGSGLLTVKNAVLHTNLCSVFSPDTFARLVPGGRVISWLWSFVQAPFGWDILRLVAFPMSMLMRASGIEDLELAATTTTASVATHVVGNNTTAALVLTARVIAGVFARTVIVRDGFHGADVIMPDQLISYSVLNTIKPIPHVPYPMPRVKVWNTGPQAIAQREVRRPLHALITSALAARYQNPVVPVLIWTVIDEVASALLEGAAARQFGPVGAAGMFVAHRFLRRVISAAVATWQKQDM